MESKRQKPIEMFRKLFKQEIMVQKENEMFSMANLRMLFKSIHP